MSASTGSQEKAVIHGKSAFAAMRESLRLLMQDNFSVGGRDHSDRLRACRHFCPVAFAL